MNKIGDIEKIERVQRRATKIPRSLWTKSYGVRLEILGLTSFNQITDKCKSLKSTSYPDIEEALILWFTNIKKLKNITVSGIELQAKALEFAQKFKHPEFKASCGSLDNLKKKNSICWKTNVGEAGLVDQEVVRRWKELTLPDIIKDYDINDIFNADESGLSYKAILTKSVQFKNQQVTTLRFLKTG